MTKANFPGRLRCCIALIIVAWAMLVASCSDGESNLLEDIYRLSPARYQNEKPSEEKIEQWKREVRRYDQIVKESIEAASQASSLYKMLAEEYSRLQMYGLALDAYRKVLEYEPANHVALYSAGLSAGQLALSKSPGAERDQLLSAALEYHLRAIEVNPGYADPYLAAAVLRFYELGDNAGAKELLTRGIELFPSKASRMMFVLAQIAVSENRLNDAVDLYDRIAASTRNSDERDSAISNREELLNRIER